MEKYICIHGHFYQPPRENPWLEDVELQDSAYPYHDWNDRITEECYRQNAASRILGPDKQIINILNNYSQISSDIGPTLLSWLKRQEPDVYQRIIEADKKSQEYFSGHGVAIAQAYNHIIMPLANRRDKETQIKWGIRDFEYHFGRSPEGMWLPETAVDNETLQIMAEHGIKFTILAPGQAGRVRKIGGKKWRDIEEGKIDSREAYLCRLGSDKSINLFFYDGGISHELAYGELLNSGEDFARRLLDAFSEEQSEDAGAQLVNIATDGESYGHHHRYGDMALAYCLHHIRDNKLANITVYGEFLEKHPPWQQVEIKENTSWSCAHGIERWRNNCGCAGNRTMSGKQQWRKPLRDAMDWLRDEVAGRYEQAMGKYTSDVWGARNQYISVINDRSREQLDKYFKNVSERRLNEDEQVEVLRLQEMQRHAMLMYTSCGWFFDNISGIEAVQVMQYALRTIQLAEQVTGAKLTDGYKNILKEAPSNARQFANGTEVFESYVEPVQIDLNSVGAHFAISSLFQEYPEEIDIFCFTARTEKYDLIEAGIQKLGIGRAWLRSNIILEKYPVDFATVYFGEHNLIGSVIKRMDDESFEKMQTSLTKAFNKGDTTEIVRLMNLYFNGQNYSLGHLFRDEQRRILYELLSTTWQDIEASFRRIYDHNYTIMRLMHEMNIPLPNAFRAPAEFIINQDLCRLIQDDKGDIEHMKTLIANAKDLSLQLDETTLRFESDRKLKRLMRSFSESPEDLELLDYMRSSLELLLSIVSQLDLQMPQNVFFEMTREKYPKMKEQADSGDENARKWVRQFIELGKGLGVKVDETQESD